MPQEHELYRCGGITATCFCAVLTQRMLKFVLQFFCLIEAHSKFHGNKCPRAIIHPGYFFVLGGRMQTQAWQLSGDLLAESCQRHRATFLPAKGVDPDPVFHYSSSVSHSIALPPRLAFPERTHPSNALRFNLPLLYKQERHAPRFARCRRRAPHAHSRWF